MYGRFLKSFKGKELSETHLVAFMENGSWAPAAKLMKGMLEKQKI